MTFERLLRILFFLVVCLPSFEGFGQSDPTGMRAVTRTYLIRNATVIVDPYTIQAGQDILFSDGIIKAIGKNLRPPATAEVIPGDSLLVYPGFIDMANKRGVSAPPAMEIPKDFDSSRPLDYLAGIHPEVNVLNHYNPSQAQMNDWRSLGFTLAQKIPMGMGILPGKTGLVGYGHEDIPTVIVLDQAAIYARFGSVGGMYPSNNLGIMAKFRDLFENSRILDVQLAQYSTKTGIRIPEKNPVLENLVPLVKSQIPAYFEVDSDLDIGRAIRLKKEFGFNLIVGGITEGEEYLTALKEWNVGAALSLNLPEEVSVPEGDLSESGDYSPRIERVKAAYEDRLSLPAKFESAGIPFGFTTKQLSKEKFFNNLRLLIAHGLSEEAALAALTINPAKLLRVDHLAGDIRVGKMANFVLTTAAIFDPKVQIKYVVVNGQVFEYELEDEKDKHDAHASNVEFWQYQANTPSGLALGNFSIWQEFGKWKGEITMDDPEKPGKKTIMLENIRKTDTKISFRLTLKTADQDISLNVNGDVSKNSFSGTMDIMGTDRFQFNATKTDKPTS